MQFQTFNSLYLNKLWHLWNNFFCSLFLHGLSFHKKQFKRFILSRFMTYKKNSFFHIHFLKISFFFSSPCFWKIVDLYFPRKIIQYKILSISARYSNSCCSIIFHISFFLLLNKLISFHIPCYKFKYTL
jgi:hypothetical protein